MEEERKAGAGGRGRADRRSMPGRWWVPGDVVLVLAVVALSVFLISRGVAGAGAGPHLEVRVTAGGEEVLTRPLHEDSGELKVTGFAGTSYLEISGGRVRMVDSACPDKLCVKSGWVSSPGESIVCLPNRVVIEVVSGDGGPDVVNQ
ncbi:MAG: NusG domain II-containing protein [Actinomycetota bacterium]|nr:NusG domain II-containing protein [Actinomycetota bacterium]MDD5666518.1 NusG domain II-containing protein [Actinomycetota bacterium]